MTDFFAKEPPSWAKDSLNEDDAAKCRYCGAWMSVVRPGKVQCDYCADGTVPAAEFQKGLDGIYKDGFQTGLKRGAEIAEIQSEINPFEPEWKLACRSVEQAILKEIEGD